MTKSEWQTCRDPGILLKYLRCLRKRRRPSPRKLRLFSCACCRRIWDCIKDSRLRQAIEASELYADGLISEAALQAAIPSENRDYWDCAPNSGVLTSVCAGAITESRAVWAARDACYSVPRKERVREQRRQCQLLREILGPLPFDLIPDVPRHASVANLAQAIYEDRAFDRLPILADALEDAGCTDQDILAHCREPGDHVLGCWVVDLILGKE